MPLERCHAIFIGTPALASNCATTKAGQKSGESTKRKIFSPSGSELWQLEGEYPDGRLCLSFGIFEDLNFLLSAWLHPLPRCRRYESACYPRNRRTSNGFDRPNGIDDAGFKGDYTFYILKDDVRCSMDPVFPYPVAASGTQLYGAKELRETTTLESDVSFNDTIAQRAAECNEDYDCYGFNIKICPVERSNTTESGYMYRMDCTHLADTK